MAAVNGENHTYDDNGNLTNDGERIYLYDAENRLTEVKDKEDNTGVTAAIAIGIAIGATIHYAKKRAKGKSRTAVRQKGCP